MSKLKLALVAMVLATPSASAFAGTEVLEIKSGSDSVNNVRIKIENEANVEIDNDADIHNDVELKVNTGENKVEDNEGEVEVVTGDAEANVDLENIVNTTDVEVDTCCEEEEEGEAPEAGEKPEGEEGVSPAEGELALAEGIGGGAGVAAAEGFGGGPLAEAGQGLALLFGAPALGVAFRRLRDKLKK